MNEFDERVEKIRLLMDYAAPDGVPEQALDLLEMYREDRIALDLLHEFYSFLPEAENDCVCEIRILGRSQGIFLLAPITLLSGYIYLLSSEGIEFQGCFTDGIWDQELLDFFGFKDRDSCREKCSNVENFPLYEALAADQELCPACHTATGEEHELGCPVEICPWCGGQIVYCDCRFEQLGLDKIETEQALNDFEILLNEKGRVPYSQEQRPGFLQE